MEKQVNESTPFEKPPPYPGGGAVPQNQQQGGYQSNYPDQPPPYFNTGASHPHPPPAGWASGYPPPPPHYGGYGSTVILEPCTVPATQVIIVGGCPACRVGILEDNFSCLGLLCAILFFPIGILCCLALRDRRCTNCGAVF